MCAGQLWRSGRVVWQCLSQRVKAGAMHSSRAFTSSAVAAGGATPARSAAPVHFISLQDMYKLSKGRLSTIVVATAAAGFAAGSAEHIDASKLAWTCAGTFACSAAANTLNQIYEIRTDSSMRRTMLRPLPAGRVSVAQAAVFAVACATAGSAMLATQVCPAGLVSDVQHASGSESSILQHACASSSSILRHVHAVVGRHMHCAHSR